MRTDATALGFTLAIAIVTGIVFGLAPALQARGTALHDALKDAARGSTEGRQRGWVRNALVVSEIAFACVLLVGAGLLIRSLIRVLDVDMGFQPARAATIRVDPDSRYTTREQRNSLLRRSAAPRQGDPGRRGRRHHRRAAARAQSHVGRRGPRASPTSAASIPSAFVRIVSDGYPAAMGIPLRAGRDIAASDTATSEPVIVVNETMARTLWPGQDPIGKYVLGGVRQGTARGRRGRRRAPPGARAELRQRDVPPDAAMRRSAVRRPGGPLHAAAVAARGAIRAALQPIAANLPGNDFRTLQQLVDKSVSPRRFLVLLLGGVRGVRAGARVARDLRR